MKDLLTQKDLSPNMPKAGEMIEGTVIKISRNAMLIDLGNLGTGIIYGYELKENKELWRTIEVGQKISAMVIDPENEDGLIELSLKEASLKNAWKVLKEKVEAQEIIEVKVLEANRGGLVINAEGVIGFLPVSQLKAENYPRVEGGDKNKILQHLNKFVNKRMQVKIITLDQKNETLIVSEKALEEEQIKETLKEYKKGDVVEGTVTSMADFGAFIKFGEGLEGMAHISELDWQMIDHPNQVVKENDQIQAKIVDIQNNQVSLSLKALKEDPWKEVQEKFKEGQIIEGQVIKFNSFGAFVKINEGIYGLNHISEIDQQEDQEALKNALEIGKNYKFKILSLEPENHKMSLALASSPENKN